MQICRWTSRTSRSTLWCRAVALGVVLLTGWLRVSPWEVFADEKPQPAKTARPAKSNSGKPVSDAKSSKSEASKPAKMSETRKGTPKTSDQKPTTGKPSPNNPDNPADAASHALEPLPPQRELAAVAFARQHHPELAELLGRLKESHPDQFAKAIRELDRTRERLEKQREIDPDRYAILLREWQLDSRVRLLAARMTMSTSAELEAELRQVLTERHDTRLQLLTYDREKSKTRLQKMDAQIAEHVQNREASIDREFDRIKKSAEMRKKPPSKPASTRNGDKNK